MSLIIWRSVAIICMAVALTACGANHDAIYRHEKVESDTASMTLIDAKQRAILVGKQQVSYLPSTETDLVAHVTKRTWIPTTDPQRFCAEPSPDVFTVVAQALSASGTFGKSADPASIQAALSTAFSSAEQGSSIPRTQTINMLRELMYRTCERYLSGGISELELPLQAIRDQRLMVSILAIEQLTGAITPKPVVINVSSNSSGGASGDEAAVRIDDAQKAVQSADAAVATKQAAYNTLNVAGTDGKDCDVISKAIVEKKEDGLSAPQKAKRDQCSTAATELTQAKSSQTLATNHYNSLVNASKNGGASVLASAPAGQAQAAGGLDRADVGQVTAVASAVTAIVASNFGQDEFLFLCLKVFAAAGSSQNTQAVDQIRGTCLTYVKSQIELKTLSNEKEIGKLSEVIAAKTARESKVDGLFVAFWRAVGVGDVYANADKFEDITTALRGANNCFEAGATKTEYLNCFRTLRAPQQRALAKMR